MFHSCLLDQEEAISLANQTSYGLAGGIWTQDISRAINVSKLIDAGYIYGLIHMVGLFLKLHMGDLSKVVMVKN